MVGTVMAALRQIKVALAVLLAARAIVALGREVGYQP